VRIVFHCELFVAECFFLYHKMITTIIIIHSLFFRVHSAAARRVLTLRTRALLAVVHVYNLRFMAYGKKSTLRLNYGVLQTPLFSASVFNDLKKKTQISRSVAGWIVGNQEN
jgi:hypothetical protein